MEGVTRERSDESRVRSPGSAELPWTPTRIVDALDSGGSDCNALARSLLPCIVSVTARELLPWSAHYRRSAGSLRDDVVQDVMLKLFGARGRVLRAWRPDLGLSLRGFLKRVVRFHVLQLFRSAGRNPWRDTSIDDRKPEPATYDASALLHQLWLWEVRDALLAEESPLGQKLYVALFVEQRSADDVGRIHDMSRDAVYQWRARFKRRASRTLASFRPSPATSRSS